MKLEISERVLFIQLFIYTFIYLFVYCLQRQQKLQYCITKSNNITL